MYMWLYKEDLASGVKVRLDEVDSYIKDGWLDTPDKWGVDGVEAVKGWDTEVKRESRPLIDIIATMEDDDGATLESMTKSELELYCKSQFGVDLDRRKSKTNMIKEIEALENG